MFYLNKIKTFLKNNFISILLILVLVLAFAIRINNVFEYNTWWADDGGAHIEYVETILNEGRLPSMAENYLAWHEPFYYIFQAGWTKLGLVFISADSMLDWQEVFGLVLFGIFIYLLYQLSITLTKNRWLALLNTFIFSILFASVKISGYVSNEFLVQVLIIFLILLFFRLDLLKEKKYKEVFYWSLILGISLLVKLTAVLVLFSVVLLWLLFFAIQKKKHVLIYIILCITVVGIVNLPWLAYKKNNFGSAFTINIYEQQNRQNIFSSDACDYIFKINPSILTSQPFWISGPESFSSILLADVFTDYYNLFNNVDEINKLPYENKIKTSNDRFTTENLKSSALWSNRLGLLISIIWLAGLIGSLSRVLRIKEIDWQKLFLYILIFGGISALVYNNLRFPYLERGILKISFIFYVLPLVVLVSYDWWWQVLKSRKWLLFTLLFLPFIIYTIVALPILIV